MQNGREFVVRVLVLALSLHTGVRFVSANGSLFMQSKYIWAQSLGRVLCMNVPGLSSKQQEICLQKPRAMLAITQGFRMAIEECKFQFQHSRWNCSALGNQNHLFASRAVAGTREAAFFSAITSAGIAHAVATACSQGNITDCTCNETPDRRVKDPREKFTWAGCNANIRHGLKTALDFLREQDVNVAGENERKSIDLMNRHNIKAGRQVVRDKMLKECKCVGVSGSCNVQTCWRRLPYFRTVGKTLRHMFTVGVKVVPVMSKMAQGFKPTHLVKDKTVSKKPPTKKLVYVVPAVNYCVRNASLGVPGTVGRKCNKTNIDEFGCHLMCCGRGYNTHQYVHTWSCSCKFYWCCFVNCKRCSAETTEYHCK